MRDRIIRSTQIAVLVVSAVIVLRIIESNYGGFINYLGVADSGLLVLSFVFLGASMIIGRYTWKMVMGYLGHQLSFLTAMRLVALFQVAAYIPGGFWHFIGISYWTEREEVPKKDTVVGTAVNEAASLLVALVLFSAFLPFYLPISEILSYVFLLFLIPIVALSLHPRIFYPLMNRVLEIIPGQERIEPLMDYVQILEIFLVNILAWLVRGAGFYFVLASFGNLDISIVPAVTALYAGAWAVGFLTVVVPGGIGVREVSAIYLLSFVIPDALAAVFTIIVRVLIFGVEILFAAGFWALDERRSNLDPV